MPVANRGHSSRWTAAVTTGTSISIVSNRSVTDSPSEAARERIVSTRSVSTDSASGSNEEYHASMAASRSMTSYSPESSASTPELPRPSPVVTAGR
jgi:hypothetical protein